MGMLKVDCSIPFCTGAHALHAEGADVQTRANTVCCCRYTEAHQLLTGIQDTHVRQLHETQKEQTLKNPKTPKPWQQQAATCKSLSLLSCEVRCGAPCPAVASSFSIKVKDKVKEGGRQGYDRWRAENLHRLQVSNDSPS